MFQFTLKHNDPKFEEKKRKNAFIMVKEHRTAQGLTSIKWIVNDCFLAWNLTYVFKVYNFQYFPPRNLKEEIKIGISLS